MKVDKNVSRRLHCDGEQIEFEKKETRKATNYTQIKNEFNKTNIENLLSLTSIDKIKHKSNTENLDRVMSVDNCDRTTCHI